MALPARSVDDRTYDQLLAVLLKQLPVADWRDHNPSDPGITLVELLAWLGEMTLYRMNRTSAEHRERYLDLVIDRPEPATVPVSFTLTPARAVPATVKAGTLLATDFRNGTRLIYETLDDAVMVMDTSGLQTASVLAREWAEVTNELLGVSDGTPDQVFDLKGVGPTGHVLLDFVNAYGPPGPNPQVTVAGVPWNLKAFLRTDDSYTGGGSLALDFMVDQIENRVRFGDGVFGVVPPALSPIRCVRYQVLSGRAALVRANELQHVLRLQAGSLILAPGDALQIAHPDGDGGAGFFGSGAARVAPALAAFSHGDRLITAEDFRTVLELDFNELEAALEARTILPLPVKIARATALMNRLAPGLYDRPGHVAIIVLREADWNMIADPHVAVPAKQSAIDIDAALEEKLRRFLDQRRLITTRLGFIAPTLVPLTVDASVVASMGRSLADMSTVVESALRGFFHFKTGHFDSRGWPFGRSVFPAEIYRLIEGLDGVDHVSQLLLNGAAAPVALAAAELPVLQQISIAVTR
jgi:hypothetical protein